MARWFQSDLSIGDRCEILEGDDFANRVVARAETPEIAAAIVAAHNAGESNAQRIAAAPNLPAAAQTRGDGPRGMTDPSPSKIKELRDSGHGPLQIAAYVRGWREASNLHASLFGRREP